MVAVARARQKAFLGTGKGSAFYGEKTQGTLDFLIYMLHFVGWRAIQFTLDLAKKPREGAINIVHVPYASNSGHFFVVDLRNCDRVAVDGDVTRYRNANVLDSRNYPFTFNSWFSTQDYPDSSYISLEKDEDASNKTEAMDEILKIANIQIVGKRKDLSFFA